jgi:hypothetical protein
MYKQKIFTRGTSVQAACSAREKKRDWFSYVQEASKLFSSDWLQRAYYLSADLQSIHVIT